MWLLRVLALGVASLLALVAGELIVRLLNVGPEIIPVYAENFKLSDNPELRYELVPGSQYLGGAINADGMRDRHYAVDKPPGVFRIACLGDSICFGYDVQANETIAGRLEEYLNRYYASPGHSFEVLNFGVTGYNITQVVENLRVLGRRHVVIFVALRDPDVEAIGLAPASSLDDAARAVSATELIAERRIVMERLTRLGILVLDVAPARATPRLISTYLDLKAREVI